ncbi:hypothetical protein DRB06_09340 [Actinomyces sp. Z5]|nr:hypothetical protein DRB06_09340 [Actinomyces sp. Z5]
MSQAIGEGSWVQGSLAGVGLAGDVLFTVTNPIAAGVSIVVGWIIEHISPLDEMLEQLTGDADAVIAGSQTWTNIADAYTQQATSLNDYLIADMADQAGQTADAWRTRAGKLAGGMNAMSAAAANIAKGLEISAAIVQFVHDMVRDAISEAIGMFFEAAAEEIFSLGLGTPAVVAQIGTWVADKVSMLASKAKDLVNSFEALSELLKKIEPGVTKLMNGLKKLDLSDWAESKGTQVGRDIKNHMSGSTPKHHTTTLTAAHTTSSTSGGGGNSASTTSSHSTSSTSSSHSTTSTSGSHSTTSSASSSGGAGSPGSGSGGSHASYHGIDPIHGDTTGTTPSSSAHSSTSSSAGATHASSSSPAASTSSAPASASMADAAGGSHTRAGTTTPQADTPATTPAVPTTDASYHGIDPIHGDTTSTPSAHNTTHADTTRADAGSGADSPRAGSSGPEGTRTSGPEADTGRTEAGDPDAGSSRTNNTDTGRADSGNAQAEADGTHAGDGADADSSRPAQHDTESAGRDAQTTPARTDADQPDTTARDGSSPETGQDTGRSERPDQPTGEGAGPHSSRTSSPDTDTPDASNPHSERAPESDRPDTQHANDTGDGKTGTDSDPEHTNPNNTDTHGRSDADADPGSNRPDEHGKQAPDEHPKDPESPDSERPKGQEPDPEHPKGQEPESVSARRDPEDNNSHSNAAAADTTTPHTKTDDTPDPTGNHKDTPDADTTHNSDTDTNNEHAKDGAADKDGQHEGDDDHNADDHADGDGADGADGDVDDRYQKSVPELFEDRKDYINVRDELLGQLDDSMPDGLGRNAFNVENRQQTIRDLLDDGYDPEEIKKLQKISTDLTAARQNVSETSAAIGEVGGQHYSDTHGAPVLDAWRNENNGHTPPGGYSDGAALSDDGKTFYELEYKGVTAKLSKTPVHTTFEGDFPQGTPEYARDHLITDPRYAQYFHDHKDVWEAIKSGKTKLCFRTISTRTPHGEPHVQDVLFDLVGDGPNGHKVRDTLQEMIDALD